MSVILFIGAFIFFCAIISLACKLVISPIEDEEQEPTTITPTVEKYLKTIKFDIY